jgi:competence protein ComEA
VRSWWGIAWPIGLGALFGLLAAGVLLLVTSAPSGEAIRLSPPPTVSPLIVDVRGAVAQPGVYELPQGSRVQDAIQAAGGALPEADLGGLNLAAPLDDGAAIRVPAQVEAQSPPSRSGGVTIPEVTGGLIDINSATQEALESLPGIGPALAQRVIEYRESNGPFPSIEAIQNVSGIGPGIFEKIKDLITVD